MGKFLKVKEMNRPEDNFKLEYVSKEPSVAVVLFDNTYTKILLVKQFRVGSNSELYEIPAGIIDPGEIPIDAMYRELREETGYEQNDIIDVNSFGSMFVSPGYTTEKIHLFRARISADAEQHKLKLDEHEKLIPEWVEIDKVKDLTNDMKTIFCLTKALSLPKMKIGIFGGSFNPVQNLHLTSIERAIDELKLDFVILEPVGDNYIKNELIPVKQRIDMLNLVIDGNSKLKLGTYESEQFIPPQTIETLNYYKQLYGWCEIYFIMGSDNLKDMGGNNPWTGYTKILKEFKIICIQRNNDNVYQDIILKNKNMIKHRDNIHLIYENAVNNISSSIIRKLANSDMSIKYLIPDKVEQYIKENNLYKD